MPKFIGGPFNPGFHGALIEWLHENSDEPLQPFSSAASTPFAEEDLERICPRHFPLSIPGDIIPGFPLKGRCRPKRHGPSN